MKRLIDTLEHDVVAANELTESLQQVRVKRNARIFVAAPLHDTT